MRARFVALPALLVLLASPLVAPLACTEVETVCTPANSGFEGQATVTFTDLIAPLAVSACNPHFAVVRSDDELRAALLTAGIRVQTEDDAGVPDDGFVPPTVDWSREVVIVREALDVQGVSWMVAQGGAVTVGTQGCTGAASGICQLQLFSVPSTATTATGFACKDLGCGGAPQNIHPSL